MVNDHDEAQVKNEHELFDDGGDHEQAKVLSDHDEARE